MTLFLYYSRSKILTRRIRCPPKVFIALMYDAIRTCDPVPQIFKQSILPCHITLFIFKFFVVLLLLMLRKEGKKAQFGTLIFPPPPLSYTCIEHLTKLLNIPLLSGCQKVSLKKCSRQDFKQEILFPHSCSCALTTLLYCKVLKV